MNASFTMAVSSSAVFGFISRRQLILACDTSAARGPYLYFKALPIAHHITPNNIKYNPQSILLATPPPDTPLGHYATSYASVDLNQTEKYQLQIRKHKIMPASLRKRKTEKDRKGAAPGMSE